MGPSLRIPLALALVAAALLPAVPADHPQGSGARSLGGATVPPQPWMVTLEAEDFADRAEGELVEDPGATGGTAWRMNRYGVISTPVEIPYAGVVWLEVRAKGFHGEGLMNPHMHPVVNGEQRGEWDVNASWQVYPQSIPTLPGVHEFTVDNFNNYHAPAEDRTLVVDWMRVSWPTLEGVPRVGGNASLVVDAPEVHAAGTGLAQPDDDARDGTQWLMWGVGCFVHAVVLDYAGDYTLTPRLKGNAPGGVGSHTLIRVDGAVVDEYYAGEDWVERTSSFGVDAGVHVLEMCYDNDHGGPEKRNLRLDEFRVEGVDLDASGAPWTPPPEMDDPPENRQYTPPGGENEPETDPALDAPAPDLAVLLFTVAVVTLFVRATRAHS